MLTHRVIPCLDVRGGRVVKGVRFSNLRDAGDPAELARAYQDQGADEVTLLDVSATTDNAKVTATGFTGLAPSTNGATAANV